MTDETPLWEALSTAGMDADTLRQAHTQRLANPDHGDFSLWQACLHSLPKLTAEHVHLNRAYVGAQGTPLNTLESETLAAQLMCLHPWRKGPFSLHGVNIETEWRSDWKWDRLRPGLMPLAGRRVLDIGTGSGYHLWRMIGDGATLAVGIEPMLLYWAQFQAIRHFLGEHGAHLLALGTEQMPEVLAFDTVFSMGVLYHQKDPLAHLAQLRHWLRPEGQLILETLVIEGDAQAELKPQGRYAQMRNVHSIASVLRLEAMLKQCGFKGVELIHSAPTSLDEQRTTPWMRFLSLKDFLNPQDPSLTVEGHPAPRRAILSAIA